jgi:hypothetical protein
VHVDIKDNHGSNVTNFPAKILKDVVGKGEYHFPAACIAAVCTVHLQFPYDSVKLKAVFLKAKKISGGRLKVYKSGQASYSVQDHIGGVVSDCNQT